MDTSNIHFHHDFSLQLRYTDADMQGHVNNTTYFQYYDTAYLDYLRTVCPPTPPGLGFVVAHIDADFITPVHITDKVKVQTAVTHIGHKSYTLTQRLIKEDTGQVMCTGQTVMVMFDLATEKAVAIPDSWVKAMKAFEGL